jgi:hypothetical protein
MPVARAGENERALAFNFTLAGDSPMALTIEETRYGHA